MTRDVLQVRLYPGGVGVSSDRWRIERAAREAGMSVSDYVRKRLGLPRKRDAKATPKAPDATKKQR